MTEEKYKNYDDLPMFLNAQIIASVLGVSPSSAYELLHEKGFPALRIGSRFVVPRDKFQEWVAENLGKQRVRWFTEEVAPKMLFANTFQCLMLSLT